LTFLIKSRGFLPLIKIKGFVWAGSWSFGGLRDKMYPAKATINHSEIDPAAVIKGRFPIISFSTSHSSFRCLLSKKGPFSHAFLDACLLLFRFSMQPAHCFVFGCLCPFFLVHDSWPPWGVILVVHRRPLERPDHFKRSIGTFSTLQSHDRLVCRLLREQPSRVSSTGIIHLRPCEAALARRAERTAASFRNF